MITTDFLTFYADTMMTRPRTEHKLPDAQLIELQEQFNVNHCDGCDDWFDSEPVHSHVTIQTEEEMFSNLFLEGEIE